jgi:L-cystine transport system substrate-binding protein
MKRNRLNLKVLLGFLLGLVMLFGFASREAAAGGKSDSGSGSAQVRKIKYAFTNTLRPVSYLDESGKPTGYDVEVIKLVDERLPQYEIELVGTSSEDAWLGVETGKYQFCTTNSFKTAAREEKYLFAGQNQGGALVALILPPKNAHLKTLEEVASAKLSMVPYRPADATYSIVTEYNRTHPNNQLKLETIDQFENADGLKWVAEGRYDSWVFVESLFKNSVITEGAQLADLRDKLVCTPFTAVGTWVLFNKDEAAFRDAYQEVLIQLKKEGILSKLSVEYIGEDVHQYF